METSQILALSNCAVTLWIKVRLLTDCLAASWQPPAAARRQLDWFKEVMHFFDLLGSPMDFCVYFVNSSGKEFQVSIVRYTTIPIVILGSEKQPSVARTQA